MSLAKELLHVEKTKPAIYKDSDSKRIYLNSHHATPKKKLPNSPGSAEYGLSVSNWLPPGNKDHSATFSQLIVGVVNVRRTHHSGSTKFRQ